MPDTLPIAEARKRLTALSQEFENEPDRDVVIVTKRGQPVLAIMPWELYSALVETLEIMGDEEMMSRLRQGIREAAAGEAISWETVKKKLGL